MTISVLTPHPIRAAVVLYNFAVVSDKLHAWAAAEHVYYIGGVSVGRVVDPTHLVGHGVFRCEATVFVGEYAFDDAAGSAALRLPPAADAAPAEQRAVQDHCS